jgi:ATP-dependent Clp protease ATP-binding subunit ClpA
MFERFTDRARRVVVVAQEESRSLGHDYIGTEHILLGILGAGESVAVRALASLGVSLEAARQQVEEIAGRRSREVSGHIPFTPRAKKVLELSLREALRLGHNYIGTEHILLGLIREGEGVAAQVLTRLGADLDQTRQQVIRLLHGLQAAETVAEYTRPFRRPGAPGGLDAIRDRLDTIAGQLAAIVTKLGIGGQAGPAGSMPRPPGDAAGAELDRLRRVIDNLQAQLRRHGIEPDPEGRGEAGPPAGAGF